MSLKAGQLNSGAGFVNKWQWGGLGLKGRVPPNVAWEGRKDVCSRVQPVFTLPRCKKSNMNFGSLRWYCLAEERPGTCSTGRVYDLFLPLPAAECWANQDLVLPKELTLEWGDPAERERRFQIWILPLAPGQFYWVVSGLFDMLGCFA